MKPATVALCLIVRDEAENIGDCLTSFAGLCSEICIVDTGSTDATCRIAKKHGARVFKTPWTNDFSAARNYGLDRVQSDMVFRVDADDRLPASQRKRLAKLFASLRPDQPLGWFMTVTSREHDGTLATSDEHRLWPNHPAHRFQGRVHEQIHLTCPVAVSGVKLDHLGYADHATWQGKLRRNLALLEADRDSPSPSPLVLYDIGRTLAGLNRKQEAADALEAFVAVVQRRFTPASRMAFRWLVDLYADLEMGNEAVGAANRGIARHPDDAPLVAKLAALMYHAGSFDLAREGFRHALKIYDETTDRPDAGMTVGWRTYLVAAIEACPVTKPTLADLIAG